MGFEVLQDTPMGPEGGPRWLEVAPPDRSTILVLFTPDGQQDRVGTFSNLIFHCDDIHATYEDLTGKGVEFADPPRQEFWGWWAVFKDADGNSYGLGLKGE